MKRHKRWLAIALGLLLVCAAVLVVGREPSPDLRRWFGLWRTRHILVALGLSWTALMFLLRFFSVSAVLRGLLVSFSVGVAWAMLELAGLVGAVHYGRLLGVEHGDVLGSKPIPNADIRGQTLGDISAGWGVPSQPVDFHFVSDRHGFRNAHDRESADVYLLGDSILVAGLLPFEQTVTGRLESELGRPVMNVALIGLSPQAERDLFKSANVPVGGSLVIQFVFEGNDLVDSERFRQRATDPHANDVSLFDRTLTHNLELWFLNHTQPLHPVAARFTGTIGGKPYYFVYSRHSMQGHDAELPFIGAALAEVRDTVVKGGGRYGVVFVPCKLRVLGSHSEWPQGSELTDWADQLSPLPEFLGKWAKEQGVPFLDTTESLAASAAAGDIPFFATDTHPNELGHAAIERAIARWSAVREWLASAR